MKTLVGITGASGAVFTLDFLKRLEGERFAIPTKWGLQLLSHELGLAAADLEKLGVKVFNDADLSAPPSSGSTPFDSLVILPCSAGTLNKIAAGFADSLLTRTAMVALKERRRLVICLRETPLSTQTLRNAAQLSADGAIIMPILPPYYQKPLSMEAVVEGFSHRLLQVIGQKTDGMWRSGDMEGLD
ncbi:MAG: UbiX family flavin prenyltransferase [candidate division FCPU426 bacterium]